MKSYQTDLGRYLKEVYPNLSPLRGNLKGQLAAKDNFEERYILENLEKIFLKYRGFTFKLPKPGEYVFMFCSGGLDSTLLWAYLMEVYKLKVIPFHFPSKIKGENRSFQFFHRYFRQKYKDYCQAAFFPKHEYDFYLQKPQLTKLSQDLSMFSPNLLKTKDRLILNLIHPLTRLGVYAVKAFEYALYLQHDKNIKVRTVFTGMMPEDTLVTRESTLTAARNINLFLCLLMGEFSWQFTSLALEPGYQMTKKDLLLFAQKHQIPVEFTWSCQNSDWVQCGTCVICGQRRKIFKLAKLTDKTIYKQPAATRHLKLNLGIKRIFYKVYHLLTTSLKGSKTKNISSKTYIAVKDGVLLKDIKNAMMVNWIENGFFHSANLNETASFVMKNLKNKPQTIAEITNLLRKKYKDKHHLIKSDVLSFISNGLGKYLEIVS